MAQREVRWLLSELPAWQAEGVIDAAAADRLRVRYASATPGVNWALVVFGVLGALLVGLGVIALLAANWGDLPRPTRVAVAFLPLVVSGALAVWTQATRRVGLVWQEPIGLFWGLSIGAAIALVAQIYHLPGDAESFALTWSLLLLPAVYATGAVAPLVGTLAGLLAWASLSQLAGGVGLLFWPLAALAAPRLWLARRDEPGSLRFVLMQWGAAGICTAAVGVTLEKTMPGLWMVIYAGLLALLGLAGPRTQEGESLWCRPLSLIGTVGLPFFFYLLIWEWPWHDAGWDCYRADEAGYWGWAACFDYALALAIPLAAAFCLARRVLARDYWRIAAGLAPFAATAGWLLASAGADDGAGWVCTFYLAGLGLTQVAEGLAVHRLRAVNGGLFVVLAVIVSKFFDSDVSFTVKGLVFIFCGSLFLAANLVLSRRMKTGGAA